MFYAHTPGTGENWHDLVSHLERTAEQARANAGKFGAGELAHLAGLWHDVGKFNPDFQSYLKRCHEAKQAGGKAPAKGVPHAVHGAMLAAESVQPLAAVIHGHHAGLPNRERLKDAVKQPEPRETYERILPVARDEVDGLDFRGDARSLLADLPANSPEKAEFFLRMVFSALVDADFLDTETHFEPDKAELRGSELAPRDLWEVLWRDQDVLIPEPGRERTPVNEVRDEVYRFCLEAGEQPRDVFRLGCRREAARRGAGSRSRYVMPWSMAWIA